MSKVKVGVAGYGVIGNRLAAGVAMQGDMELVGVADIAPTLPVRALKERGMPFKLFTAYDGAEVALEEAGIPVSGGFDDLLGEVDVMLDAAPGGIGAKNKEKYVAAGVKAVFQGGESGEVADVFFHGTVNYEKGLGVDYLKLTSCNTTGLIRAVDALHKAVGVTKTFITIIRRVADPGDIHRGLTNVLQMDPIPNHQAVDLENIMEGVAATGLLVHTPVTHGHIITMSVTPKEKISVEEAHCRLQGLSADQGCQDRRWLRLELLAVPVGPLHGVPPWRHVRDRSVGRDGRTLRRRCCVWNQHPAGVGDDP